MSEGKSILLQLNHSESLPKYSLVVKDLSIQVPNNSIGTINSLFNGNKKKKKVVDIDVGSSDHEGNDNYNKDLEKIEITNSDGTGSMKLLINHVNLEVQYGEVCSIIGGSGSGKTTFLNSLAGRLNDLKISTGEINFIPISSSNQINNGTTSSQQNSSKLIGFVRQEDQLLPYLTVLETLTFAASLRLPKSISNSIKLKIIEQTMIELGLKQVENVIVGGNLGQKGISGGERRRLSIGCVLVTLPSILILDEPTSGLDSFTAYQLLETLSNLAKNGNRIVILSIHQPRSDAFPIFDKILLLSNGSTIYSGPTSKLLPHFKSQGFIPDLNTNPLDFVVNISSIDTRTIEEELKTKERVGKLILAWREVELTNSAGRSINSDTSDGEHGRRGEREGDEKTLVSNSSPSNHSFNSNNSLNEKKKDSTMKDLKRSNYFNQIHLLTKRGLINVSRNYGQNLGFLAQSIIIGVVLGLAFLTPPETPSGIQSIKTIVYMTTPAYFYLAIIVYIYILTSELKIFDREREDNYYSTLPAVISLILTYLIGNIVFPTLFSIIIYFMTGFRRDNLAINLFSFIAQCIMQQLSAFGYALLCSSITRSFATASLIGNGFSIPFILSSGYLIVNLPVWIAWTRWISPYFYGFHWIARLQFTGREFACIGITGPARNACSGTAVLIGLDFPLETPLYVYPLGLLGFILATHILSFIVLEFYHPGGVKHASSIPSNLKEEIEDEKERFSEKRERVDVLVEGLGLVVTTRSLFNRKKIEKSILTDVDAFFPAGQVSVIMGPSGSGKSSLLQLLAGRLSLGPSSNFNSIGNILFNGQILDSNSMNSVVAFVEQEDLNHLPALTVRETLYYAANLRIRNQSKKYCNHKAEEILIMLGLKSCADNLVGGPLTKGISGGEKRRLSLAVQLLSDPSVLIADEPLSGLDAFTAYNVMLTLKSLASTGRTVIVSVHQPNSNLWNLFDNVLLLVKGGRTAFSGKRSEILEVFKEVGEICPEEFNPADFILDSISVDHRSIELKDTTEFRVSKILLAWKNKYNITTATTSPLSLVGINKENNNGVTSRNVTAPFFKAFLVVISRSFKNMRRQQDVFVARLINPPFLALLFFLFFGRLNLSPSSTQTRVGLLQEVTALPFIGMLACISIFPFEKSLFYYEYKSSARHSVATFLLAYSVQEALVSIVGSLLFSVVMVYGIGLQSTSRIFIEFWISTFCLLSTGESIGIIFSAFFQDGLSISLVSAGITLLSQLNGIISVTLPNWLEIIGWISPMKAQSRVQIINEMTGLVFECTPNDISTGACIATTGEQLLSTFNIPPGDTGKYIGILFALIIFFRFLAYLAIRTKVSML